MSPIAGLAPLELLVVAGLDRERLVHGLVSGEVRKVEPQQTAQGFVTNPQGRILADYRLVARPDAFWLLLPRGSAPAIAAHFAKYQLASRVEMTASASAIFQLRGDPTEAQLAAARDAGFVLSPDPAARTSVHFVLPAGIEGLDSVGEWLRDAATNQGVRWVDEAEMDRERIEAGELRFGIDFGPDNFPQETGRDGAVSYTKGCYLGQEIVARIHYRGGVQKRPCMVRFEGELPEAGVELALDGRAVGRATSVARSASLGPIGLGILHQRGAEFGTRLSFEGGSAVVVALPLS